MSTWTDGEVLALKKHGNAYARAVWLANAPPIGTAGRPKEGDDLNVFKRFIVDVYENRRYYSESGSNHSSSGLSGDDGSDVQQADETVNNIPVQKWKAPAPSAGMSYQHPPKTLHSSSTPQVSVQPVKDLLDFGTFDDLPSNPNPSTTASAKDYFGDFLSVPIANTTSNATFDLFANESKIGCHKPSDEEDFGDFNQAITTPSAPSNPPMVNFDPFSNNSPHPSGGIVAATSTTTCPTNNTNISFDAFSNTGPSTNQYSVMMNHSSLTTNSYGHNRPLMSGMNQFGMTNSNFVGMYQNNISNTNNPNPIHSMNGNGILNQAHYSNQTMNPTTNFSYGLSNGNIIMQNSSATHQGYKISGSFMSPSINAYEEKKSDPFQGLGF